MAKKFDINKFNSLLSTANQTVYAVKITGKEIELSNGLSLTSEQDVRLCKKRVLTGHNCWRQNFDDIYSIHKSTRIAAEKQARSVTSKQGGINCQLMHKEIIKHNLNTGIPWNKGTKGDYPYAYTMLAETKEKISAANTGSKNGMYGTIMSAEDKLHRSNIMKEKILNGTFTPNSNNRNTHWDTFYKNKKYRSSWEALYQYFDKDAEYETIRIPYVYNNKEHIYIVDFVNHDTKTLIEVKPEELMYDEKTKAKINAAKEWSTTNGYAVIIANKEYFINKKPPTNLDNFDDNTKNKIRKLYETS